MNTSKLPVLKNDETRTLLLRARSGDIEAREALIAGNLRLVLSVLQRFAGRGESVDDLFQVGCVGLIKAVDNFDVDQPVRFSTYGVPMIAGEIRRYLRDNSALRVSRSLRDLAYKTMQAREAFLAREQRDPTPEELGRELGVTPAAVAEAMDALAEPVSLSEPVYGEAGETLSVQDKLMDEKNTDAAWLERLALSEAVETLPERERRILARRFLDGRTQMEVAGELGISQAQVSRLEKSAVGRIKAALFPAG